ncbi:MAG: aminoglycoside phosphotransferase family protein [Pirellulaceae bacterium]
MKTSEIPSRIYDQLLEPHKAQPAQVVAGSGLSSAEVFRCVAGEQPLCLRCWPAEHPSRERLQLIHAAMQQLTLAGISITPKLFFTRSGDSFCFDGQRYWELTSWLPGAASYATHPSEVKLDAAMTALADIHQAWFRANQSPSSKLNTSPTVSERVTRLANWLRQIDRLRPTQRCEPGIEWSLANATCDALRRLGPKLLADLEILRVQPVGLHFSLRDIWSEHVLFSGDTVSGVIDFGALRVDEPLTDIVRLIGSLEPVDVAKREFAINAYENRRQGYYVVDRARLAVLAQTATLLSAVQWMQWLIIERRTFKVPHAQLVDRWSRFVNALASHTSYSNRNI